MAKELLRMEGITKVYPNGFMANKDVTLSVSEGEIHALMGENGAGKTTLMKILNRNGTSAFYAGAKLKRGGKCNVRN